MRCHLIIDADDTLWENNIYFEQVFDEFVEFLAHPTLTAPEIRDRLDDIERVNARVNGYGSRNFGRNLAQCYRALCERDLREQDVERVRSLADVIRTRPVRLLEGVEETLAELERRHELTLFTKGDPVEQQDKIDRSGLARHFHHIAIVKEKDVDAYLHLAAQRAMVRHNAWMVGNSPKSDINPALAAGLNAVFVPHARTWTLEREEIRTGPGRLLILDSFARLLEVF